MDSLANILLEYPPENRDLSRLSSQEHDVIIRRFINRAVKAIKDGDGHLQKRVNVHSMLKRLDPGVHTISYLAVLDHIYGSFYGSAEFQEFHPYLLRLLVEFNVIQIRFVGSSFLNLLEHVSRGQVFPPSIAVKAVVDALLRLDPTNQVLTSTHLAILKLAYDTNTLDPQILPLLETKIIMFPGASPEHYKPLSQPILLPQSIFAPRNGLTRSVSTIMALEYYLLAGTTYIRLRQFPKAVEYFMIAVTFPTREKSISEMMVLAYKRWVLTNLLVNGTVPDLPTSVSGAVASAYRTLAKEYLDLATVFANPRDAAIVKEESTKNASIFSSDSNSGLVDEVLVAFQRRHIINLQDIYTTLPVSLVRNTTQSAVTGARLGTDQETVELLQSMIEQHEINASLTDKNGTLYLHFNTDDEDDPDEISVGAAFKENIERLRLVQRAAHAIATRAETHSSYIQYQQQQQQRVAAGHGGIEAPPPHVEALGEEDLMGGVTWS